MTYLRRSCKREAVNYTSTVKNKCFKSIFKSHCEEKTPCVNETSVCTKT